MDQSGDLALGFNASSVVMHPAMRIAGRLAGDPINTLGQGESTWRLGAGSQMGTGNAWGTYSDMTVDPVDDCTFWYTNEYYQTTSSLNWRTGITSFRFPSCSAATPTPSPTVTPTNTPTSTPTPALAGSLIGHVTWQGITQPNAHNSGITATLSLCVSGVPQNFPVYTDASGFFTVTLNLPVGSYNWGLKAPINLGNSGNVPLAAGTNNVEFGLMKAGDCNNNNVDNTQDFNILKATFAKAVGDPGYDSRADFNRDTIVNTQDFTLLKNNFGQAGSDLTCP